MAELREQNLQLEPAMNLAETYLFDRMTPEEKKAIFNVGSFYNDQVLGLTADTLRRDGSLKKLLQPVSTFQQSSSVAEKYIAIAEGKDLPLYAVTYHVEMAQFYFEDLGATKDEAMLDHSLIARHHAQALAELFVMEARMNKHRFEDPESVFEQLVRHSKLVSLSYQSDYNHHELTVPVGLTEHNVYLL